MCIINCIPNYYIFKQPIHRNNANNIQLPPARVNWEIWSLEYWLIHLWLHSSFLIRSKLIIICGCYQCNKNNIYIHIIVHQATCNSDKICDLCAHLQIVIYHIMLESNHSRAPTAPCEVNHSLLLCICLYMVYATLTLKEIIQWTVNLYIYIGWTVLDLPWAKYNSHCVVWYNMIIIYFDFHNARVVATPRHWCCCRVKYKYISL